MSFVPTSALAARLLSHIVIGRRTIGTHFHQWSEAERSAAITAWSGVLLQHVGMKLEVVGSGRHAQAASAPSSPSPALFVANHMSWLDIFVINAWQPAVFVSKAEVKRWPVLGPLVTGAGTLYIEREKRRDALKVVHEMAEVMKRGRSAAAFPEGTTGWGDALMPFHANLLQAAVVAQVPVQPLALRYLDGRTRKPTRTPAWVGEMSLVQSLRQLAVHAKHSHIVAQLHVLPQIAVGDGVSRRELAQAAHSAIGAVLSNPINAQY
jgi:1-acyl-sn-glycerol-3-phosphate acyltransferase